VRRVYEPDTREPMRTGGGGGDNHKGVEVLRRNDTIFRSLLLNSSDIITVLSIDGTILYESPSITRILGYEPEQLIGKNAFSYIHEEDRAEVEDKFRKALECGEAVAKCFRFATAGGEWRWVESIATNLLGLPEVGGIVVNSRDIGERRKAEETLREVNELLLATIQASPLAVIAIDRDRNIRMWNPAAERLLGWTEAEVLGSASPLASGGDLRTLHEVFDKGQAGIDFTNIESEVRRRDGTEITISLSSAPIRDSSRRINGVVAIIDDITEKKRSEHALRVSEERFSKAFNFGPRPMSITTIEDARFVNVNTRFLEEIGLTAQQVIGKTLQEAGVDTTSEDKERISYAINTAGSIPPTEIKLLVRGREPRVVLVSGEVIDLDGQKCVLSAFEDITGRKRAEEEQGQLQAAVQKAALEWRLTFDAVDYPVLLLDFAGRVVRVNRAAKETSGKSYWEIKGKPADSIGKGEPWQKAAELAQSVAGTRANYSCQIRDDVTAKTWDMTASAVSGSGSDERIIVVARDITATVELQDSLRKSETMSAMGALVAGVAHEVRNPLFSISATLDAFEARFGEKEEHRRYIDVLRGELDRLNQLMQDLLEYGRPATLEMSVGSLKDAVRQAVHSCQALAERAGVSIAEELGPHISPVMMDRGRIVQVFQNLIANAIQHSPAGQTVTIKTSEELKDGNAWIDCCVADCGPGFSSKDLPRIFEPFFTKRRGGTGLGLSIVQRIIEEHGGKIFASNQTLGGAVMRVRLKGVKG
jgi:PAS domain S-box-containing protein